MINLLSVNGELRKLAYDPQIDNEERSTGYKPVAIGQPLVIRYLNFFLCEERSNILQKKNQIMISTYVKVKDEKKGAAEAINYYNPEENSEDKNTISIDAFGGGEHYGHELIYYTPSYLGESVRMTTRVMELNNVNDDFTDVLNSGISTVAGLPAFSALLPYATTAQVGVKLVAGLINFIKKDNPIFEPNDIALHFRRNNSQRIQSGRIVCIDASDSGTFLGNKYSLTTDNRLVKTDGKKYDKNKNYPKYKDSSYYVLQIDSTQEDYEDFEHYQNAAELLGKTNRQSKLVNPQAVVSKLVEAFSAYNDRKYSKRIRALSRDNTPESQETIRALYKLLSSDMQQLYDAKLNLSKTDTSP